MITPQEYNELRIQEQQGQEMAAEKTVYSIEKRYNETCIS